MYEAHFGLSARPFGETVSPAAFVPLPSRETVLRRLRYGIEHGQGPALLYGMPGTGKTLLVCRLAQQWGGRCVHLVFPVVPAPELVALLTAELSDDQADHAQPAGLAVKLRRLRSLAAEQAARGQPALVVVDEAHLIDDPAAFEVLRLLLNFASSGPPDLRLLILGAPEVLLRLPPALAERLTARCLLAPLSEAESAAYVAGRLNFAGARECLFSPGALAALHRASDGLPRRLNRLADYALLIAYARDQKAVDETAVALAARESHLEPAAA